MRDTVPIFTKIIDLIFSNKELPYYSAERRLDAIISIFIEEILGQKLKSPVKLITSEFPLKQDSTAAANEIDYLCKYKNSDTLIYVELKTDIKSYDVNQLKIYLNNKDWKTVVDNFKIKALSKNIRTSDRVKYYRLIELLYAHGIIKIDDPLIFDNIAGKLLAKTHREKLIRSKSINKLIQSIRPERMDVLIVYLGPEDKKFEKELKNRGKELKAGCVEFISFNEMREMKIDTPYHEEWDLLSRKLLGM